MSTRLAAIESLARSAPRSRNHDGSTSSGILRADDVLAILDDEPKGGTPAAAVKISPRCQAKEREATHHLIDKVMRQVHASGYVLADGDLVVNAIEDSLFDSVNIYARWSLV